MKTILYVSALALLVGAAQAADSMSGPAPASDDHMSGGMTKDDGMKHDAMKGGMKHDGMKHDGMKHTAMKGGMKHDSMKGGMKHDAMKGDAMKGDAMSSQDSMKHDDSMSGPQH